MWATMQLTAPTGGIPHVITETVTIHMVFIDIHLSYKLMSAFFLLAALQALDRDELGSNRGIDR